MSPTNDPLRPFFDRFKAQYPFVDDGEARKIIEELEPFRKIAQTLATQSDRAVTPSARQVRHVLEHLTMLVRTSLKGICIEQSTEDNWRFLTQPDVRFVPHVPDVQIERKHANTFFVEEAITIDATDFLLDFLTSPEGIGGARFLSAFDRWWQPSLTLTHFPSGGTRSLAEYMECGFVDVPHPSCAAFLHAYVPDLKKSVLRRAEGKDIDFDFLIENERRLNETHLSLAHATASALDSIEGLDEPSGLEAWAIRPIRLYGYGEDKALLQANDFQLELLSSILAIDRRRIVENAREKEAAGEFADIDELQALRDYYALHADSYRRLIESKVDDDMEKQRRYLRFCEYTGMLLERHERWVAERLAE